MFVWLLFASIFVYISLLSTMSSMLSPSCWCWCCYCCCCRCSYFHCWPPRTLFHSTDIQFRCVACDSDGIGNERLNGLLTDKNVSAVMNSARCQHWEHRTQIDQQKLLFHLKKRWMEKNNTTNRVNRNTRTADEVSLRWSRVRRLRAEITSTGFLLFINFVSMFSVCVRLGDDFLFGHSRRLPSLLCAAYSTKLYGKNGVCSIDASSIDVCLCISYGIFSVLCVMDSFFSSWTSFSCYICALLASFAMGKSAFLFRNGTNGRWLS